MRHSDAPMSALPDSDAPAASRIRRILERHIPRDWADEIQVVEAGVLERAEGERAAGSAFALVAVSDWIAWRQAFSLLAPYVENEVDEWLAPDERDDPERRVIKVWEPSATIKQSALIR